MKLSTFIAAAAAFAGCSEAFWRMECRGRVGLARIDPIISPGEVSQHVHAIHGSSGKCQHLQSINLTCQALQIPPFISSIFVARHTPSSLSEWMALKHLKLVCLELFQHANTQMTPTDAPFWQASPRQRITTMLSTGTAPHARSLRTSLRTGTRRCTSVMTMARMSWFRRLAACLRKSCRLSFLTCWHICHSARRG